MFKVIYLMIILTIFLGGLCLANAILNPVIMKGFYKDYKAKGGKKTYKEYCKMFDER